MISLNPLHYVLRLTRFEKGLWLTSLAVVTASYLLAPVGNVLALIASLVGVTSLIFVARGEVLGQVLMVTFSILYAIPSYQFSYYGEMITYLGMTGPISAASVVTWLRHPYEKGKPQVKIAKMSRLNCCICALLTIAVTIAFYFILKFFGTANLWLSTLSVTTSFAASYLMLFRNDAYAIAYSCNDLVLVALWVLATLDDSAYFPMIICFSIFFVNDMYGFINWRRMKKKQSLTVRPNPLCD